MLLARGSTGSSGKSSFKLPRLTALHEAGPGEGDEGGAAAEAYTDPAYPADAISIDQIKGAIAANDAVRSRGPTWDCLGPDTLNVDRLGTRSFIKGTQWSGRVTTTAATTRRRGSGSAASSASANPESFGFYAPAIADPVVGHTIFVGGQHVWRTTDLGGGRSFLEQHCNTAAGEFGTSDGLFTGVCGTDWFPLGGPTLVSTSFGTSRANGNITAVSRGADHDTIWASTSNGRVFVSKNANAADPAAVTSRGSTRTRPRFGRRRRSTSTRRT